MKVAEWISQHPGRAATVAADCTLEQVMERVLADPPLRDVYVVDGGKVIGHLNYRRLAHLMLAEHRLVDTLRQLMERFAGGLAEDLMETHFTYARPDEELDQVLHRQLEHDVEDMAVISPDGSLLGSINMKSVLTDQQLSLDAANAHEDSVGC